MNLLFFLKQFFKDFKHTGAVAPSSKALTNNMLKGIDFNKPVKIVELGPGTGCMTEEILKRMHPDSELTCIEINPIFCQKLEEIQTDKNLTVLQASAQDFGKHFEAKDADFVVSGLPLANFKKEEILSVFNNIKTVLKKSGEYIQFQYTLRLDKLIKDHFTKVLKTFSFFNLPPAFVYSCSYQSTLAASDESSDLSVTSNVI